MEVFLSSLGQILNILHIFTLFSLIGVDFRSPNSMRYIADGISASSKKTHASGKIMFLLAICQIKFWGNLILKV